jgi:D-beta-D-heptose 7-phosphate kinase/D-beta-D-heptose 1-phosphate adenosyltransferase
MESYKVLLVGESCIDKFIYGECSRLNPEAPTPVFIPKKETTNGGMARNVLENLKSLGVTPTFITNTEECIKTRYVDEQSNYILLRIDEDIEYKPLTIEECGDIGSYDVVIISDYDKGLITPELVKKITNKSKLTFMDTKKKLSEWALGVNYIKLNKDEYNNNKHYVDNWLNLQTIVTLGGDGCMLNNEIMKGHKVDVRDVVGAGDTFLSSLVVDFLKNGGNIYKAMEFANKCAGNVVQYKGVVTPNLNNKQKTYGR